MALRVGIDIDGVLADFRAAFRAAAQQCLGRAFDAVDDPKTSKAMAQGDVRKVWEWVAKKPNCGWGCSPTRQTRSAGYTA